MIVLKGGIAFVTPQGPLGPRRTNGPSVDDGAEALVRRFAGPLSVKNWAERLAALTEMHDQLVEDINDFNYFCEVFPRLVNGLIKTFGSPEIASLEQAQIYANSSDPAHRDAAGVWMKNYYGKRRVNEN